MTVTTDINEAIEAAEKVELRPPEFADESLALRFAERYHDELRYVAMWGKWLLWDEARWQFDDTLRAFDLSRTVCREASAGCDHKGVAKAIASAKTVAAVVGLARADRRLAATVGQWDADPWLLNTPGGVVDLRTGEARAHRRDDHMTKITAVAPGGECPMWRGFLERVTDGDAELQLYLQRVVGYGLTGNTREHALFFLYGTGANGKTVFLNSVGALLGDYHTTAPMETFIASSTDRHPTELAALRGARLVTATETEEGRRWAEAKLKALVGGDRITARFMRQDFFTFTPQFTLIVAGNHKPGLRNVDEAMRRRLHLVPFTVTIPEEERDETLPDRLKEEWSGILAWAIEGAVEWTMTGLRPPELVRAATDDYLSAEDALARWIDECCVAGPNLTALTAALYANWREWCERAGEYAGSMKRFSQNLEARDFERWRNPGTGGRGFRGLQPIRQAVGEPQYG